MTENGRAKAPTTFWIIAVLSLLWSGIGAADYLQTSMENHAYLNDMARGMGLSVEELVAHYRAMPWWSVAFWAFGVWGSVAGSILLLLRSRYALHAFLVSLAGLIVTTISGFMDPLPGQADSMVPLVFTAIVFVILIALIQYARRMIARRVLS